MKKIFLMLLTIKCMNAFCQNLVIDYQVKYKESEYKNRLILTDSLSEWQDVVTNETENQVKLFLLKKNANQLIFFSDFIFGKNFYVMDTLHNMNWILTNNRREIMGKNCSSAKTNFRGRDYIAYYTIELPYYDGPWKFGGLPGLILSVESIDEEYKFMANKIDTISKNTIDALPIKKYKFLKWNEYVTEFKKVIDNTVKFARTKTQTTENDIQGFIKIDAPEIIYPKAQIGEGIKY